MSYVIRFNSGANIGYYNSPGKYWTDDHREATIYPSRQAARDDLSDRAITFNTRTRSDIVPYETIVSNTRSIWTPGYPGSAYASHPNPRKPVLAWNIFRLVLESRRSPWVVILEAGVLSASIGALVAQALSLSGFP